jgi:hypothetical protein
MVLKQHSEAKILAYEMEHDIYWEPGVPEWNHPDYWELRQQAYRNQIRQDGFYYDLEVDQSAFPDFNGLTPIIDTSLAEAYQPVVDIPNPIVFDAWFDFIEYLDYPCTFQNWPVMSPQMLETIRSVGDFHHFTYPTQMEDTSMLSCLSSRTGRLKNDFLVVQTLEFLDAYDWEKSEYVIDGEETKFTKMVLKEPIPSLFRLVGNETRLYVSAAAKEALEASNTSRGVNFTPIDEKYEITLWDYRTKFSKDPVDT